VLLEQNKVNLHFTDGLIIFVYFAAMAGIGVYFTRKNTSILEKEMPVSL
jgi:hypothetical protein